MARRARKNSSLHWKKVEGPGHSQVRWVAERGGPEDYFLLSPGFSNNSGGSVRGDPARFSGTWYLHASGDEQGEMTFQAAGLSDVKRQIDEMVGSTFQGNPSRRNPRGARKNSTGFVAAKIRAHTNAKRNPLIPTKGPTGARPALPDRDFTFRDVGVMAGFAGGPVDAVMLDGHYVWWDAALDRLNRMGFSLREARDYLASLPNIGTASYSP